MAIKLAAALQALRSELVQAQLESKDAPIKFKLGDITLKLEVEVQTSTQAEAKAGLDWILASFKGGVKTSSGNTQTLTLTLHPVDAEGKGHVQISDEVDEETK